MKKGFIISMIFISAVVASAQKSSEGELAGRSGPVAEKRVSTAVRRDTARGPGVLRVGPSTTYLKKGLKAYEVVRFLGWPLSGSERREGDLRLATYTFARGEGRVLIAEFENDSLVTFRTAETDTALAQHKTDASGQ
jgi:hypothetical protein